MSSIIIKAHKREKIKNVARKKLRSSEIPCVFYGYQKETLSLLIDRKDFEKKFQNIYANTVIDLEIGSTKHRVLLKDFFYNLKNRYLEHLDFFAITPGRKIKVKIPINVTGKAKGIEKGGILQHLTDELSVKCLSEKIPNEISIDVSKLDLDESIYVKDLTLDKEIEIIDSADRALVSVMLSSRAASEANENKEEETTAKQETEEAPKQTEKK